MPTPAPLARERASALADHSQPERALYEQVADAIRDEIFSHHLGAGSWIDEKALASAYGISRTPLREALKVLAAEGLVTMKLRRGAYVTEVSARDLAEVFHLLALLEGDAARALAARVTPDQLTELEAMHLDIEAQLGDRDRFFQANERFHMRMLELAGNHWQLQMVSDLRKVMKLSRHHSLFKQGRLESSLSEHRRIMTALRTGDAEKAELLVRKHIVNGGKAAASA